MRREQVLRAFGEERRPVVALEDQRRSMFEEERLQRRGGVFGGRFGNREPGELLAARQVADREEGVIDAIDRRRRLGVVHRPDGARALPT